MAEENGVIRVSISDVNSRGQGVAKVDGKVVFVPFSAAGDALDIRITKEHKNFSEGEVVSMVEPSGDRIAPECPLFGKCGGCSLRHVSYEAEGRIKKATVEGALRRFGLRDVTVNGTLLPRPDRYRNKATFRIGDNGSFGYYEKSTNTLVPLGGTGCALLPEEFCEIARDAAAVVSRDGLRDVSVTMRRSADGEIIVLLSVGEAPGAAVEGDLVRAIAGGHENVTGIVVEVDGSRRERVLFGSGVMEQRQFGLDLALSPRSFFQVNYGGAEMLLDVIDRYADATGFHECADLFCGTGVWGLALAKRFPEKRFYGADIDRGAIRDAKENAARNGLRNVKFFAGDAARIPEGYAPDLVILDPPRRGCSDGMVAALVGIMPEDIIYVSCDPFTMARDAAKLRERGYAIKEVTPVNMFPRTEHVECVVLMTKR